MKKKIFWTIGIVLVVLVVIVIIAAFNTNTATDANQGDDVTTKVKESTIEVKANGAGTIVPKNQQYPDYDDLELSLQIDEMDIADVKKGQEVTIDVTAYPDRTFTGEVESISEKGTVESNVAVFTVMVELNDTKDLKAGMTVSGSILVSKKEHVLNIPIEAVQKNTKDEYYVLVPKKDKNNQTKKTKQVIKTGIRNDNIIEVKKGLQKGEEILLPSTSTSSK
ncbi:HlyD family efflux transporter periplasmic adaptor subunit [Listeria aquatica]|uniref:HlyD family efflux transporter periplasmic adaptor subunit n=1 Tax=Listeria aquatica TaxID=1494960 RepID=A0A841ZSH2_9LIST|nr:HlyD family efflux transporter periplasmic adaptor subunit [Listeria aquatica]MBC1522352.1 HlyD family efflux transporter periplasmic adaptor subunit [Listeria aquatica]